MDERRDSERYAIDKMWEGFRDMQKENKDTAVALGKLVSEMHVQNENISKLVSRLSNTDEKIEKIEKKINKVQWVGIGAISMVGILSPQISPVIEKILGVFL